MPNEVACAFSVLFFYVLSFCLCYVTAIPYYVILLTVLDISGQQPYRKHFLKYKAMRKNAISSASAQSNRRRFFYLMYVEIILDSIKVFLG